MTRSFGCLMDEPFRKACPNAFYLFNRYKIFGDIGKLGSHTFPFAVKYTKLVVPEDFVQEPSNLLKRDRFLLSSEPG